jgi:transcriptional regulator with PAS, ATPase and Fis domain
MPTPADWGDDRDCVGVRISQAAALDTLYPEGDARLDALVKIARSNVPVLLVGESGVGKEVLARAIHARSQTSGPFVAVNCGALPSGIVEGLLFGHTRGAFSSAVRDEPGLVRAAEGGTLFLDEIGDLPLPAQATLRRVL